MAHLIYLRFPISTSPLLKDVFQSLTNLEDHEEVGYAKPKKAPCLTI